MSEIRKRLERHLAALADHAVLAVLLSGGVDSAVVAAAARSVTSRACAVTVRSEFVAGHDLRWATQVAEHLRLEHHVCEVALLDDPAIRAHERDRCYRCKLRICDAALAAVPNVVLLDGTAADDDPSRPGRRALRERRVRSPLAECGLGKDQVLALAAGYGLPNADRPSNSCLATRLQPGRPLRREDLARVARLEEVLRDRGFTDVRARINDRKVIVEIPHGSEHLLEQGHEEIMSTISGLGLSLAGYAHRKKTERT